MRTYHVAVVFMLGTMSATIPAFAADLGGDCCADLEERIAELEATTGRKGNRKVSLTVYGKVNEAIGFWDDGVESNVYQFTNDTSRTRFGFKGKAKINSDWFAKFRIEIGIRSADQGDLTADSDDTTGAGPLDLRRAEWTLGSKTYGSITVGETKFANDGVTQAQLANVRHFANPDIFDSNDEFQIRSGRNQFQDVAEWGDAVQVLEPGEGSRGNVVRYDSPTFAGFKVSAAFGEDDVWNAALRYAQKLAEFEFIAAVGYGEATENDEECGERRTGAGSPNSKCENFGVSASLMHAPSGLFLTGAYGRHED